MYQYFNPNPLGKRIGDCVVRAMCKATGQDWETTYAQLFVEGYSNCDMPSANAVWGAYLRRRGFVREVIPNDCPDCYTVDDFCNDHPKGMYILAIKGHVCTVVDGTLYDSWDSSYEIPLYYWHKEEEK